MLTMSIRLRLFISRACERVNVLHVRFLNANIGDGAPRLTHRADMRIAKLARRCGLAREPDGAGGVRFVRPARHGTGYGRIGKAKIRK